MGSAPDLRGPGTPESTWSNFERSTSLPAWRPSSKDSGRVLVVAPHPDDEILGAGGTIARLCRSGARIELIAVTDGEGSHPGMEQRLRHVRPNETLAAAARLGIGFHAIHRLRHPDGRIDEARLADQLDSAVRPDDLVLAPWPEDGHPDHDAAGRAAERAARSNCATLLAYLVWAWHWAQPEDIPWERALRVDIADLSTGKREAAACFHSQIAIEPVILPDHVLRRLLRSYEVLLRP